MPWPLFDRKLQETGEWSGFLEQGVRFEGKLEAPGTFRIDARLKGDVVSEVMLILGEHAVVEGQIDGNAVVIGGRFEGKVQARSRVEIQTGAVVSGDIQTPSLAVEPGAVFDGRCHIPVGKDPAKILVIPIRSVNSQA